MAVTKIWDIRGNLTRSINYIENPEKTENAGWTKTQEQSLEDVMMYAENEEKTEQHFFVTGINCFPDTARSQFITVKKQFNKEGGIVAYHAYQSFAPGEATPEIAHEIGVELARRLWGDNFQVIVATHLNTKCLHNHFVLNSVSFVDGKRYHDCKETYRELRKTSDQICREYGLTVIEHPSNERHSESARFLTDQGEPTTFNLIRDAVDRAIEVSWSMDDLQENLKRMGYLVQFNPRRKFWTITPKGKQRPIRLARLGEEYTNERIKSRLEHVEEKFRRFDDFDEVAEISEDYSEVPSHITRVYEPDRTAWRNSPWRAVLKKTSNLYRTYLYYCYLLSRFSSARKPEQKKYWKVDPEIREDIIKLEKYSKETELLGRNHIETTEDLAAFKIKTNDYLKSCLTERAELNKQLRRKISPERSEELKRSRMEINQTIRQIKKELIWVDDIETHEKDIKEKIEKIKEKNQERDR